MSLGLYLIHSIFKITIGSVGLYMHVWNPHKPHRFKCDFENWENVRRVGGECIARLFYRGFFSPPN